MRALVYAAMLWSAQATTTNSEINVPQSDPVSVASTSSTGADSQPTPATWGFLVDPPRIFSPGADQTVTVSLTLEPTEFRLVIQSDDHPDEPADTSTSSGDSKHGLFSVTPPSIQGTRYVITIHLSALNDAEGLPHVYYFTVTTSDGEVNSPAFGVSDPTTQDPFSDEQTDLMTQEDPVPAEGNSSLDPTGSPPAPSGSNDDSASATSAPGDDTESDMGSGLGGQDDSGSKGGGGLAKGAIAGIAIGAFVAVVLILGLVWFFLRRRKQASNNMSVHPDASTPLAGYPNATAGRSGEFMGEKEAGAMAIAESPRSQMYTDQPSHNRSSQGGALGTAAVGGTGPATGYTDSGHQVYDAASSPPPARSEHATPPPPRDESSRTGMNSPVPSTTVARHLVDPDMTEDDIRRLEEEERELDRQIQEAGRRK